MTNFPNNYETDEKKEIVCNNIQSNELLQSSL